MKIGDTVHFLGTVRDVVENSVLVQHAGGREHWFDIKHLTGGSPETPAVPEAAPAPAKVASITNGDPNFALAVKTLMSKGGYSEPTATEIVEKNGPAAILRDLGGETAGSAIPGSPEAKDDAGLPSAADLDAVAKEQEAIAAAAPAPNPPAPVDPTPTPAA